MNVIQITPDQAVAWENFVQQSPRTVAWQSYHWNDAISRLYQTDFLPLAAFDGPNIVGILPLYQLKFGGKPSRLLSAPYAVAAGMTAESVEVQKALLDAAAELARQKQAPGITFKQYRYKIELPLMTDGNFFNRELSLDMGEGKIWDQLNERNRTIIDSTAKWNLVLDHPTTRIDTFYNLLFGHLKRQGLPCPSPRWIQTLLDLKMYSIALLERDGKLVAGTMLKTFKTTVSFPYTCYCDGSADSLAATYALYWKLIQKFTRDGYKIFHSGRMPHSEEVEQHRLGWGGQKHAYFYQYYPETGGTTEFKTKRGWKRQLFTTGWKFLPSPIAKAIGPKIIAKFP